MINIPAPLRGRPFYVSVEGGKMCVSVRDAFHLERELEFNCHIRLTSERNGHRGACRRTRNLLKARQQFQAEEARWYASSGLELRPRNLIGGGMNGMVAGWIVSLVLFLVCGGIAFALAKIVNSLDQTSAIPDESRWNTLAQDARPAFSGEVTASAATAGADQSAIDDEQGQRTLSTESGIEVRGIAHGDLGTQL